MSEYDFNKIHYCPICGHPYLDDPVGSMIIDWMNVCPDCACQEKNIYPYVFNYMRFLNDYRKEENLMRKWRIVCSVDADDIDYEEVIYSDDEPDYWTCYNIAESHGCQYFVVTEIE